MGNVKVENRKWRLLINIEVDIREVPLGREVGRWIELAQNRIQWRVLLSAVERSVYVTRVRY